MVFCSKCGAEIAPGAQFCANCGGTQDGPSNNMPRNVQNQQPNVIIQNINSNTQNAIGSGQYYSGKSKGVAAVLALLLGGIGAHKFYMGKSGAGCMYFLFCWTFIPAFISLIEGLMYIFDSDEAFERRCH